MSEQSEQDALATFESEVKKNYRWNFTAMHLDWVFFQAGIDLPPKNWSSY